MTKTSDADVQRLFAAATAVKANAYCPYSHFRVGAAVLCRDGTIFSGCNVENCAYPSGCCAERSAIVSAVSGGHRDFTAILVTSDVEDDFVTPCGFCRQVIAEFGNLEVISTKPSGESLRLELIELLPRAFSPAILSK
jgi:cytidine deaminase